MFSSGKKASRQAGKAGGSLSFIGSDLVVSGDVTGIGQLHVDGRVDGNVRCEALVQGRGGTIAGHIDAETAHLAGLVDGTVKARVVTLDATARVTGDVAYETLSIAAGAVIEGRVSRRAEAALPEIAPVSPSPSTAKKSAKTPKAEEPGLLAVAKAPAAV